MCVYFSIHSLCKSIMLYIIIVILMFCIWFKNKCRNICKKKISHLKRILLHRLLPRSPPLSWSRKTWWLWLSSYSYSRFSSPSRWSKVGLPVTNNGNKPMRQYIVYDIISTLNRKHNSGALLSIHFEMFDICLHKHCNSNFHPYTLKSCHSKYNISILFCFLLFLSLSLFLLLSLPISTPFLKISSDFSSFY